MVQTFNNYSAWISSEYCNSYSNKGLLGMQLAELQPSDLRVSFALYDSSCINLLLVGQGRKGMLKREEIKGDRLLPHGDL